MNILFVCRGNTCRSVLAHFIALSLQKQEVINRTHDIRSAGVDAFPGQIPSDHTLHILKESYRLDASPYRAQRLNGNLVGWADVIYTMTPCRRLQIVERFPAAFSKLQLLGDRITLEDPIGGSLEEYEVLSRQIDDAIRVRFKELDR